MSIGLEFPEILNCLKYLIPIGERLIMPRLLLVTIRSLGYQTLSLLKGALVNVSISANNIVISLPRSFHKAHAIQIHIRRRLHCNHDYMTDTIRPAKIMEVLQFIVNTPHIVNTY